MNVGSVRGLHSIGFESRCIPVSDIDAAVSKVVATLDQLGIEHSTPGRTSVGLSGAKAAFDITVDGYAAGSQPAAYGRVFVCPRDVQEGRILRPEMPDLAHGSRLRALRHDNSSSRSPDRFLTARQVLATSCTAAPYRAGEPPKEFPPGCHAPRFAQQSRRP